MKKFVIAITSVIAATAMVACGNKVVKTASSSEDVVKEDVLEWDSIVWQDSTVLRKEALAQVNVICQYPVSESLSLADSINAWIVEMYAPLALTAKESYEGAQIDIKKEIAANPSVGSYVKKQAEKMLQIDTGELKEILDNYEAEGEYQPNYAREVIVRKVYEDSLFVTMQYTCYQYFAGAHGSYVVVGETFSKEDGHRMRWELLSAYSDKELRNEIKNGIKKYFEVKTDEELCENLMVDPDESEALSMVRDAFPMPNTYPCLMSEGVVIMYQQYEIAPYAAGLPSCVLKKRMK